MQGKVKSRDFTGSTTDTTTSRLTESSEHGCHGVDKELNQKERIKMRQQVAGMVEKKTYIGLVSHAIYPSITATQTKLTRGRSRLSVWL